MEELEQLKKKRLEQMQSEQLQNFKEESEFQQQVEALEDIVRARLTKDALQRYGNLKTAHPEKAIQLLAVLAQAIQAGQIKQVNDDQLKFILGKLSEKKEFRITRK